MKRDFRSGVNSGGASAAPGKPMGFMLSALHYNLGEQTPIEIVADYAQDIVTLAATVDGGHVVKIVMPAAVAQRISVQLQAALSHLQH